LNPTPLNRHRSEFAGGHQILPVHQSYFCIAAQVVFVALFVSYQHPNIADYQDFALAKCSIEI